MGGLGHLQTREIGAVLEAVVRRIERHLRRRGLHELGAEGDDVDIDAADDESPAPEPRPRRGSYRPWAELLARTFGGDVLACPKCHGRMKLVALIKEPRSITRFLTALGEPTDVPTRSPSRGPLYWKSTVLRRKALGEVA